jgi:RHS repeat-associated protein
LRAHHCISARSARRGRASRNQNICAPNDNVRTVSFYDALGRRIGIDDSGTQTWTGFNGNTADDNPYADFTASGSLQTRYLDGLAVDELFARTSASGATAWYLRDNVGSFYADVTTTMVLDAVIYDPYGNIVTETNASEGDRFKFAGMEYDSVTGLYYDHARYYDAAIGRFVSQDPMGFAAGDTNVYRYVGNAPTDDTDTSGLGPPRTDVIRQANGLHDTTIPPRGGSGVDPVSTMTPPRGGGYPVGAYPNTWIGYQSPARRVLPFSVDQNGVGSVTLTGPGTGVGSGFPSAPVTAPPRSGGSGSEYSDAVYRYFPHLFRR